MRRKILTVASAVSAVLCACTPRYTAEDAAEYVRASLDAGYKAEFDDYVNVTNADPEQAEEMYRQNVENVVLNMGADTQTISEELVRQYEELAPELLALADYTVTEAVEDEYGFAVTVIIRPFRGYQGLEEELTAAMQEEAASLAEMPDETGVSEMVYKNMLELLNDRIHNPVYGEEEAFIIHVEKTGEHEYAISEDDIKNMDFALFAEE